MGDDKLSLHLGECLVFDENIGCFPSDTTHCALLNVKSICPTTVPISGSGPGHIFRAHIRPCSNDRCSLMHMEGSAWLIAFHWTTVPVCPHFYAETTEVSRENITRSISITRVALFLFSGPISLICRCCLEWWTASSGCKDQWQTRFWTYVRESSYTLYCCSTSASKTECYSAKFSSSLNTRSCTHTLLGGRRLR